MPNLFGSSTLLRWTKFLWTSASCFRLISKLWIDHTSSLYLSESLLNTPVKILLKIQFWGVCNTITRAICPTKVIWNFNKLRSFHINFFIDIPDHVRQHVMRCLNNMAHYIGNPKEGQKLSIVFPLGTPQAGSETVREHFSFVCKSSCPVPGMNRREIEVIFTLENGR